MTYVERLPQVNPPRLRLDVKVVKVPWIRRPRQAVSDGPVVISVLVRRGHPKDVRADIRVLLHVLDVFLEEKQRFQACFPKNEINRS